MVGHLKDCPTSGIPPQAVGGIDEVALSRWFDPESNLDESGQGKRSHQLSQDTVAGGASVNVKPSNQTQIYGVVEEDVDEEVDEEEDDLRKLY